MRRLLVMAVAIALLGGAVGGAGAQAPIESELTLITPVSKFIHDAALKAFADYAKEKWNVTVRTNAIPAGTPVAYWRIVEWKGKPDADIFWGGESALFEKLAEQKLLQKLELGKEAWDGIPASIGKPKPIPLKDKQGYWVGTALEPLTSLQEASAVLFLALGGWETIPVGIFAFYIAGSANEAAALGVILIAVAAVAVLVINRVAGARMGGMFG